MVNLNKTESGKFWFCDIPKEPGTYVLVLRSDKTETLNVGRLGEVLIRPGFYLYVGSAFGPGGLRARLSRHWQGSPKMHWHIDYLRRYTEPEAVWFEQHRSRQEHRWVVTLSRGRNIEAALPKFGASDCRCTTHLFFSGQPPSSAAFRRRLKTLEYSGKVPSRTCTLART